MIRRGLSWAWFGLAGIAVVLALLVTLLRWGAPVLANWPQYWLDRVLSEHSLTLEVGRLGLSWQDYGPVLVLEGLSLHRPRQPALTLERALVDVHLWQSLRQWRPVLNEVVLDGLRLPQAPAGGGAEGGADLAALRTLALEGMARFELRDARFVLSGPGRELLELHLPTLSWRNGEGLHQGEGRIGFGPDPAQQFLFRGRLEGDPERLDGGIYLQADGVDAGAVLAGIRPEDDAVSARLAFELWLEWRQGELAAGLLTLGRNRLGWGDGHEVAIDGGRVQWQPTGEGWQLASRDIGISVDGESWPSWHFQLDSDAERLRGYLDRMSFTDLALLAQWGEDYWPRAARQLAGIAPRGQLTGLWLSARPDGRDWRVGGALEQVSTRAFGWVPQTAGLSGSFALSADQGRLALAQRQAADWHYQDAFRQSWPMRRLDTELHWQRRPGGWRLWSDRLGVDTADLDLQGWFNLELDADRAPLLSASATVDLHRAERAFAYFPEPLMGTALVDYLQGAIRAGRAEQAQVLWYGSLDRFPYADGSGLFQARVPLREAEFQFNPHWQPLTGLSLDLLFENNGLFMSGPAGRLGEVDASAITARIAPLAPAARLELNADIRGEGDAVTAYLQQSALADSLGRTLEQIQVSGPLAGRLALGIPLRGGEVDVAGEVDFAQNRVRIRPLDLPLTEVSGRLLFDRRQTRFEGLSARWLGQPLTLDYLGRAGDDGYRVGLDMQGRLRADVLAGSRLPVSGETDWRGRLQLDLTAAGVSYEFEADSGLTGWHSRLPAPLAKAAEARLPLAVRLSGDDDRATLAFSLAPDIEASARLGFGPGGARIERLWVTGGDARVPAVRAPFDVALRLPELALDDWLALLAGSGLPALDTAPGPALSWPEQYRVEVSAQRARLRQQPLDQLRLELVPAEAGRYRLDIDAEQARGELEWGGEAPVEAVFSRLWLDPEPGDGDAGTAVRPDPGRLPALQFRCEDCRWRELALGGAGFRLDPVEGQNGVRLSELWLDGPLLQGTAQGQWLQHDGGDITRLQWQGGTHSLQGLWQGLGQASPFSDTQALLQGELSWQDLPWRPRPDSLQGRVEAETGAGVLTELDDRGAGLLSALSVDSVLRRLRLDFRDVFEKGFYFDRIRASGDFEHGVLHNEDFLLEGAAGDLRGEGRIDLVAEQLDYRFDFTPHLTGNLPVLAAFAVTPVTGLYVLALSKVLGPVVDVFTRIRYRVSGPLDQPEVNELGRDRERLRLANEQ